MAKTRILLTGANSLTGSHILSQLLSQGLFSVRVVVDSRDAAHALQQQYPRTAPGSLDLAIVLARDASVPGIFEAALSDHSRPFELVIHALAHRYCGEANCLAKAITLETETVTGFLASVKRVGRAVRRVAIVTSLTHFARWLASDGQASRSVPGHAMNSPGLVISDPENILATSQASDNIVYEAVSRWAREARVPFDIAYLVAPSIYGPTVRSLATSSDLSEANRRIWNICCNEAPGNLGVPPHGILQFLDARVSRSYLCFDETDKWQDLAFASIRALFIPPNKSMDDQMNTRFFIAAGIMPTDCDIARLLVAHYPRLRGGVGMTGAPVQQPQLDDPTLAFLDTFLTTRVLGISQYHSAEATLAATAQQIVEFLDRKSWKHTIMRND